MGATNQNTLEAIASRSSATMRVPDLPSLPAAVEAYGLKEGLRRWQEQARHWTRDLEREINERMVKAQPVSPGPPG